MASEPWRWCRFTILVFRHLPVAEAEGAETNEVEVLAAAEVDGEEVMEDEKA